MMEASTRFELVMTVLQTVALPLGDEAIEKKVFNNSRGDCCQANIKEVGDGLTLYHLLTIINALKDTLTLYG